MAEHHQLTLPTVSGLGRYRHVCVLYRDREEEYRVLGPFIAEGIRQGDRAFHVISRQHRADHLRRLRDELGIDVHSSVKSGQLEIRVWEEAQQCSSGFDQRAMLTLVEEVLADAKHRGFQSTRWVANMASVPDGLGNIEEMVAYCTRLDDVLREHDATIVCAYDLARFTAGAVIDILRSHPVAIIGGIVYENPFDVSPNDLLRELQQRQKPFEQGLKLTVA
jgi:hypothetical protein